MKDTQKIIDELGLCDSFKRFYDENKNYMITQSLSQMLEGLLEKKNMKKADVIKRAELSEIYAYQIFSGTRVPERKKLLCIAIAMQLDLDTVQKLLKSAGYSTLYVKIPFDSIIIYGICNGLSVVKINDLLFEYGLELLG